MAFNAQEPPPRSKFILDRLVGAYRSPPTDVFNALRFEAAGSMSRTNVKSSAQGTAGVVRSGMDEDMVEQTSLQQFAIGTTVMGNSTCKTQVSLICNPTKMPEHVENQLLSRILQSA